MGPNVRGESERDSEVSHRFVEVEGKQEFIWVGSTEPKANLNKSNNGPIRVQREGGLWNQ